MLAYKIAAAVAMHPAQFPLLKNSPMVPVLFTTGSADAIVPPSTTQKFYQFTEPTGKAIAEITGATHFEPTTVGKNRLTPYVTAMFDCHIKEITTSCNMVYGTAQGSMCNNPIIPMTSCMSVPPVSLFGHSDSSNVTSVPAIHNLRGSAQPL